MGNNPAYFQGDQRPIEQVSWIDIVEDGQEDGQAVSFLSQINQSKAALPKALQNHHFRLPTEAEWEYAAKGSPEKK